MLTTSPHLKKNAKQINCIFFDLDGTLLDSSQGIFEAIEYAFTSHNLIVDFKASTLRQYAGRGVEFLFKKINNQLSNAQLVNLKQTAFSYYQKHAANSTSPFFGIDELLNTLHEHNIAWGIVTSKTRELTEAVITQVPQYHTASIIVCADDLVYKKPHPMPLIHAIQRLKQIAQHCAYIGDTKGDMLAAKYAHCCRIFADYGYEADSIDPSHYDMKISTLEQLRQWIIYTHA